MNTINSTMYCKLTNVHPCTTTLQGVTGDQTTVQYNIFIGALCDE